MKDPAPQPVRWLLYLLVFTAGFTVMLVEITGPRILGPFLGTSVHVWTHIIGVILAALSIGYYVGGRIADRRPRPALLALIVMGGCALAAVIPVAVPWFGRSILPPGLLLGEAYNLLRFGSLVTALCLFFPPALLLAVVGPFTIRCVAAHDRVGRAAGTVFALGTVGSILGTFLPTFLLIPWLGSRATVLGAAALLDLVAVWVYVAHRGRIAACVPALVVIGAAMVVAVLTPIRGEEYGDRLIEEGESEYQYVRVGRIKMAGADYLQLQVNEPVTDYHSLWRPGQLLTGSYYDHYALLPGMISRPSSGERELSVLILGLAGGVISRQYHAFFPGRLEVIDGVEVDPVVVDLARRHFALDAEHQPRLVVHVLDGRLFLKACGRRYDIIIIDAYTHQVYMPPHMATVSFFREVNSALETGGVVALNASSYNPGVGLLPRLVNTMARAFGEAFLGGGRDTCPNNFMLFAFKDRADAWPPAPRAMDSLPGVLAPLWTAFTAPHKVLRFPDHPAAPVFTDDDCPVEILATEDLARTAARYSR